MMGMRIVVGELKSATIDSHGDHRVAMIFIAGIVAGVKLRI